MAGSSAAMYGDGIRSDVRSEAKRRKLAAWIELGDQKRWCSAGSALSIRRIRGVLSQADGSPSTKVPQVFRRRAGTSLSDADK